MKIIFLSLLGFFYFLYMPRGVASGPVVYSESEYEYFKSQFLQIDSQDGIQKVEADLIGKYYLFHVLALSAEQKKRDSSFKADQIGSYSEPKDKGYYWQMDVQGEFAYATRKSLDQKIYISKVCPCVSSTFSSGMGSKSIRFKDVVYSFRTYQPDEGHDYVTVDCGPKEKTSKNLCLQVSKEIADGLSASLSPIVEPIEDRSIDVQLVIISDCRWVDRRNRGECYNWQGKIPLIYKPIAN